MSNILLTGAGSGIGYQTVIRLLQIGSNKVFAISRNLDKLNHLEKEARGSAGQLIVHAGDICQESDRKDFIGRIKETAGELDILINNASILFNKSFEELTWEDWVNTYRTNVFGVAALIRDALPCMMKAEIKVSGYRAHIVNIGSMGGLIGTSKFPGLSAYSSSKAALAVMTECLAEEFKEKKIAVNSLALGSVQTEMFSTAFPGLIAASSPAKMAAYIADFAINGDSFFNGKNLPVSVSTP